MKNTKKDIRKILKTPVDYSYSEKDVTIIYCEDYDPYKKNTVNVVIKDSTEPATFENFWGNKR